MEVLLLSVTQLSGLAFYSRSPLTDGGWGSWCFKESPGEAAEKGDLYVSLSHITFRFGNSRTGVKKTHFQGDWEEVKQCRVSRQLTKLSKSVGFHKDV